MLHYNGRSRLESKLWCFTCISTWMLPTFASNLCTVALSTVVSSKYASLLVSCCTWRKYILKKSETQRKRGNRNSMCWTWIFRFTLASSVSFSAVSTCTVALLSTISLCNLATYQDQTISKRKWVSTQNVWEVRDENLCASSKIFVFVYNISSSIHYYFMENVFSNTIVLSNQLSNQSVNQPINL